MPPYRTSSARVVGDTPVARGFFAGQYARVVAETVDAPAMAFRDEDVAFAVGALTFVSRVEDAQSCFDAFRRRAGAHDPRTFAASRFFLGVAYARAGDFTRSHELLVVGARARVRVADDWAAAFAFQGLACQRYFTGRYRASARHALRALRAAHAARFAYVQMLSTDLRGHALAQIGQFEAGMALLRQAKSHAERLGFGMNAYAIDCSIAVYTGRFKVGADALRGLEVLAEQRTHDSYSRRLLLTREVLQYALRGRGSDALAALEQVDRDALRIDARRAKVTSLIARLYVARWGVGFTACAHLLEDAADLVQPGDVAFRSELLGFEVLVGRALADPDRAERALAELRTLARDHEHHLARASLAQFEPARAHAFAEDELSPLLAAVAARDERALPRLLALGLLGPVPELLGLAPARRVLLLPGENVVLVEDRGDLWLRPGPPRWCPPLLRLLASGDASKEAIVAGLWGLRSYRPERHDPLVRTTIHRLRAFLEPRGDWVVVTTHGYGLAVPVHVVGNVADAPEPLDLPLPEDDPGPRAAAARTRDADGTRAERLVQERLVQVGVGSAPEIARALDLSESTVLRALRVLVRAKRVSRAGAARATRYRSRG